MICGHCGRRDADVDVGHVRSCGGVYSLADVEELLERPAPPIHLLLDGIAVSKRERRYDLCDRCIQFAIASVTGETPDRDIRNLAREAAQRQVADVKEESLPGDLERTADSLREMANSNSRLTVHLYSEVELLDHLALYLARNTSPALVAGCARLRKMSRSDLALSLASRAALMSPNEAAPRVAVASALIDLERASEGLDESMNGEALEPSEYTSSTLSRAHRVLDHLEPAIDWAEETIRRNPESLAGYRTLVAAAMVAKDDKRLELGRRELASRKAGNGTSEWSGRYVEFLTATEFLRSGERTHGLATLRRLSESGYEPAMRELLEYEVPRSRPADGRPPR